MDLLINDPIKAVNTLLISYDIETVQKSSQTVVGISTNMYTLKLVLETLFFSVSAGKYNDSLQYATTCRKEFNIYKNVINEGYIKILYEKYTSILTTIKTKLLDEFDIVDDTKMNDQLSHSGELLELLSEYERIKFLQQLSFKICNNIPSGPFNETYVLQLNWIHTILDPKSKFILLKKWDFNKFIIDAWSDVIRDNILEEDETKLKLGMLKYVKEIESDLNKQDLISISFDPYCARVINEKIDKFNYVYNNCINNCIDGVYEPLVIIFKKLSIINEYCIKHHLINPRNDKLMTNFMKNIILQYLTDMYNDMSNTSKFYEYINNLSNLKRSLDYVYDSCNNITKQHYSFFTTMMKPLIKKTVKHINKKIYNYYKDIILPSLKESINNYKTGLFQNMLNNIPYSSIIPTLHAPQTRLINLFDQTNLPQLDVSHNIYNIVNILQLLSTYNKNIILYLLADIDNFYKTLIDINNLLSNNIKNNIFEQILMDICFIKNSIKDNGGIFIEVENKVKFLNGDVLDEKIFVEQFKTFYITHNLDTLKKIIKFKNIGQSKSEIICGNYNTK